jgi:hypothetical protein
VNSRFLQILAPASGGRTLPHGLAYLAAAGLLHLLLVSAFASERTPQLALPVTEVEIDPLPTRPPPPQAAAPAPPPPAATPEPAPPAKVRARRAPEPPAAAHAGKLLTADETAEDTRDEPVRFVSDPNGRGYGTGIVARGGLAEHGAGNASVRPEATPRPSERITPADKLQRQPALIGDACRGFFPEHARPDQGLVSLVATVQASGGIVKLDIESETPTGEGFATAARACLARRKFIPALDELGKPTAARTRINLRFTR